MFALHCLASIFAFTPPGLQVLTLRADCLLLASKSAHFSCLLPRTEAVTSIYQTTVDIHDQYQQVQQSAQTLRQRGDAALADQADNLAGRMKQQVVKGCSLLQEAGSTMPPLCNDIVE